MKKDKQFKFMNNFIWNKVFLRWAFQSSQLKDLHFLAEWVRPLLSQLMT